MSPIAAASPGEIIKALGLKSCPFLITIEAISKIFCKILANVSAAETIVEKVPGNALSNREQNLEKSLTQTSTFLDPYLLLLEGVYNLSHEDVLCAHVWGQKFTISVEGLKEAWSDCKCEALLRQFLFDRKERGDISEDYDFFDKKALTTHIALSMFGLLHQVAILTPFEGSRKSIPKEKRVVTVEKDDNRLCDLLDVFMNSNFMDLRGGFFFPSCSEGNSYTLPQLSICEKINFPDTLDFDAKELENFSKIPRSLNRFWKPQRKWSRSERRRPPLNYERKNKAIATANLSSLLID